jgi:hypothetical protein
MKSSLRNQPTAPPSRARRLAGWTLAAVWIASLWAAPVPVGAQALEPASTLLDISGVAWMEEDLFVAVHDGKNNDEERARPRVSLLFLPADVAAPPEFVRQAAGGVYFRNLDVDWFADYPNDLEASRGFPIRARCCSWRAATTTAFSSAYFSRR